ncbi:hypothetical protein [Stenomitos frigidus]|uniref:DUF2281 domain-containing protein n=1 Tax=Stenomitos frigidus ULC18 TaxID=2107698 RepID=A0A2T1DVM0_9CYAN|nr:hypothetical protein [Stenomitos frigidus]PSB24529.1 hypothetical protein C7B82_26230 [Stenomitos frigidus ULC18]
MESIIKTIITKLNSLPQTKLHEVLDFVEFVTWQEQHTAQSSLSNLDTTMRDQDFETLTNQLLDEFDKCVDPNLPLLSDYAVSRAGIYEEHP